MLFKNLGLEPQLVKAVSNLGFETPTEIQAATIPLMLEGKDVVGIAQTGTGKTAAFGLPLVQQIDIRQRDVQALILAPTRELALQSSAALETFAKNTENLKGQVRIATIYGGAPYPAQVKQIKDGAQIVVATPGRLIDMMNRKAIHLDTVRLIVLDEADEMLKMGFQEDIETIFEQTDASSRQTALFSATMPGSIKKISAQYMRHPEWIEISAPTSTVDNIKQEFAIVQGRGKTTAAQRFVLSSGAKGALIFTRTRGSAEIVGVELASMGMRTATISGDVAQKERERIIERMRSGKIQVLVATDVAARGIDIELIELVINYDLPDELENYIHRIGRTGRAGRKGHAISFVSPRQTGKLKAIEKLTGAKIKEVEVPDAGVVRHQQAEKFLQDGHNRSLLGRLKYYEEAVVAAMEKLENEKDLVQFVSSLVALNCGDTGTSHDKTGPAHSDDERGSRGGYQKKYSDRKGGSKSYGDRGSKGGYGNDRGDRRDRSDRSDRGDRPERGGKGGSGDWGKKSGGYSGAGKRTGGKSFEGDGGKKKYGSKPGGKPGAGGGKFSKGKPKKKDW